MVGVDGLQRNGDGNGLWSDEESFDCDRGHGLLSQER